MSKLNYLLSLKAKGSYEFFSLQAKALKDARCCKSSFLFDIARRG